MAFTTSSPDPTELYIARLGTPHSQATARSALRAVAGLLGVEHINWTALTYADLAGVRAGLNGYSTAWGNTCWTVTRQVLVEARRLGTVDARMVDDVLTLPRLRGSSGRLGRDLDDNEVAALLVAVAPDSVRNRRDGCLLALLIYGGLRRSECVSVAVDDWNPATRVLTVRHGKGRKVRSVPLPTTAASVIDRWLQVHPGGGGLLRGVDRWEHVGGPLSSAAIPKILEQLCRTARIAPVSAHAFRARRLTEVIAHPGGCLSLAAQMAGHSSTSVTTRYDRRGDTELADLITDMETSRANGPARLRPVA
jgi:integrase/recombinase XerD